MMTGIVFIIPLSMDSYRGTSLITKRPPIGPLQGPGHWATLGS